MKKIKHYKEVELPAVIKFSTSWCMPCKMLEPIFNKLEETFNNFTFYSVDLEEATEDQKQSFPIAAITSVPTTLVITVDNKEVITGAKPMIMYKNILEEIK